MAHEEPWTVEALTAFLEMRDISTSLYGTGHAHTISEFTALLNTREVELSGFGPVPILNAQKAKVDIYCDAPGQLMYLVESGQEISPATFGKSWRRSASVLVRPDEAPEEAICRGLTTQACLHLGEGCASRLYCYDEYYPDPRPSNSFPGFLMEGRRYQFAHMLDPSCYTPGGYFKCDGTSRPHFDWYVARFVWPLNLRARQLQQNAS